MILIKPPHGLARLIDDFKGAVRTAVDLLVQSGVPRPHRHLALGCAAWVKQSGTLEGGVRYFKHGFGCLVLASVGRRRFSISARMEKLTSSIVAASPTSLSTQLAQYGFADDHGLRRPIARPINQARSNMRKEEATTRPCRRRPDQELLLRIEKEAKPLSSGAAESIAASLRRECRSVTC